MSYGQRSQNGDNTSDDALFAGGLTTGVGVKPENFNPDGAESLHSDDQSISWQRNRQEIGNKIMNFPGESLQNSEVSRDQGGPNVIEPTMPPELNSRITDSQPNSKDAANAAVDYADLRIIGDKISAAVVKKAKAIEREKIWENDDAAGYNDAIRDDHDGVTVTLLDNSFSSNSAWKRAKESSSAGSSKIINLSDYASFGRDSAHKETAWVSISVLVFFTTISQIG